MFIRFGYWFGHGKIVDICKGFFGLVEGRIR